MTAGNKVIGGEREKRGREGEKEREKGQLVWPADVPNLTLQYFLSSVYVQQERESEETKKED